MIYSAIYAAVQNSFDTDASLLVEIKDWIRAREGEVWQYADWPIKKSVQLNLVVTGGTATIPMPAGVTWPSQGITIRDNFGDELAYMEPNDFFAYYGSRPSSPLPSAQPVAWTLTVDPTASAALVFRVGPTPAASGTYTVHGWNQPIKRTAAAVWSIGTMSADSDLPWWPDEYHYFLVAGAVALGGQMKNYLDWQSSESTFQAGLERLRKEQMPTERIEVMQWGNNWGNDYQSDYSWP